MTQDGIDQDDAYWLRMMGTRWSQPTLSAGDVATLLNVGDPADLLRRAPLLPGPERDPDGTQRWSRATIYDYILLHQPELQDRVPRLYPFTAALAPATFLFGQVVDGMAVHAWQPGDGRGPIAVAYAGHEQHENELHRLAKPLLARLPWATAVCLPEMSTHRANDGASAPYVAVADRHRKTDSYGWFEVAGLLRVDLPWWPPVLRNVDAIAAWQPGAPVQRIRARVGEWPDPRRLAALVTKETSEYVTSLVRRAIEFLNREAASGCIGDQNREQLPARRGLLHAAVADIDLSRPAVQITKAEVAVLLHQNCDDAPLAADVLRLLVGHSPISGVLPIPITSNPLAAEWIARLEPADGSELGFWKARGHREAAAATMAYRDPLNPHCWVAATADTIYSTVGRSVPATGQLTELFYERNGGLFRDSRGTAWPLPATGFGVTDTGPSGGRAGKETLLQILTNLILDASGDITRREVPYSPNSPLAQLVARTEPPLVIKPGDPVLAIGER